MFLESLFVSIHCEAKLKQSLFRTAMIAVCFTSLAMALLLFLPSAALADAEKIFRENNKAVVVIVSYDSKGNPISQGSGFVIREDGAIVTNYHVIARLLR